MEKSSNVPLPKIGGSSSPFLNMGPIRGPQWELPDTYAVQDRQPLSGFKSLGDYVTGMNKSQNSTLKTLDRFARAVRSILSNPETYGVKESDIDDSNLIIYGIEKSHIYRGPTFIAIGSHFTNEEYYYAEKNGIISDPSKFGQKDANGNDIIDINVRILKQLIEEEKGKLDVMSQAAQLGDRFLQGISGTSAK